MSNFIYFNSRSIEKHQKVIIFSFKVNQFPINFTDFLNINLVSLKYGKNITKYIILHEIPTCGLNWNRLWVSCDAMVIKLSWETINSESDSHWVHHTSRFESQLSWVNYSTMAISLVDAETQINQSDLRNKSW